jgi:Zn-dependent peptidase ImmA (M78 family)
VAHLHRTERGALSAVTVFWGTARAIVNNDAHLPARQASNLTHELAHGLLLHPPAPALDQRGCRLWNQDIEDEADWLGGTLLIPGPAARAAARRHLTHEQVADKFGCSIEMARWRMNMTGALRMLASARGRSTNALSAGRVPRCVRQSSIPRPAD